MYERILTFEVAHHLLELRFGSYRVRWTGPKHSVPPLGRNSGLLGNSPSVVWRLEAFVGFGATAEAPGFDTGSTKYRL